MRREECDPAFGGSGYLARVDCSIWVGMSAERSLTTTDSSLGSTLDTVSALTPDKT